MHPRFLGTKIAYLVVLGLMGAGCSAESAPPESPESTTASPRSDPTADSSPSASESAAATPDVKPATGEQVVMDGLTFRLPETFLPAEDVGFGVIAGDGVDSFRQVEVVAVPSFGKPSSVRSAYKGYLQSSQFVRDPTLLKPVTIDGVKMFHAAGQVDSVAWLEGYGAVTEDFLINFTFYFRTKTTPAQERRRVAESVLATVEITD